MKLYQVRKGQFVYYDNELHRVYSVKPKYKQSVHLVRLKDLEQHITEADKVIRHKPNPFDSFIFNKKRYTLHAQKKASEGDFILITNPKPDYLDHYSLNEIEKVASVEDKGVITNRSNGIKHSEYMLMIPGRDENSHPIDKMDNSSVEDEETMGTDLADLLHDDFNIGDVYKKTNTDALVETMVVAIDGDTIVLGGDMQLTKKELSDTNNWEFLYNLLD